MNFDPAASFLVPPHPGGIRGFMATVRQSFRGLVEDHFTKSLMMRSGLSGPSGI